MEELADWDKEPRRGHPRSFVDAFPTGYGFASLFLSSTSGFVGLGVYIRVQDTLLPPSLSLRKYFVATIYFGVPCDRSRLSTTR